MKKQYVFDYDFSKAEACLEIDTDKFTEEMALATLNFFLWDWDQEGDPIDEVAKKYAIQAIRQATYNEYSTFGVKSVFEKLEGFVKIDGSSGIELTHVEGFEFNEDDMTCDVSCV